LTKNDIVNTLKLIAMINAAKNFIIGSIIYINYTNVCLISI